MVADGIIQRLKKLLALAGDSGATEAEAETAARMAQDLLVKHNLSMEDLLGTEYSNVIESVFDEANPSTWKQIIWNATAELYFCCHLFSDFTYRRRVRRFIVGRPDNVETVKQMAPYFIRTARRAAEADAACKRFGREYTKNFLLGCAWRLNSRMKELLPKAETGNQPGTGLMVLYDKTKKEVDDFLKDREIQNAELKTKGKTDSTAFYLGWNEGGKINLNAQIADNKRKLMNG